MDRLRRLCFANEFGVAVVFDKAIVRGEGIGDDSGGVVIELRMMRDLLVSFWWRVAFALGICSVSWVESCEGVWRLLLPIQFKIWV